MDAKSTIKRMMFGYPGSKWNLAPRYVRLFPEHSVYVSPFVGTGAELAFKSPSKREIINDLDDNIYAVFSVLRDERWCKQLVRLLEYSHDCRRLYYECHDRLKEKDLGLLQRAYCFLVVANLGFQGIHPLVVRSYSCGLANMSRRILSIVPALRAWHNRIKSVKCENIDAFDLIEKYDHEQTLFYLDPPYHSSTRKESLYLHDVFDHGRFVRMLQQIKGKAFLCGYEHGLYNTQLMGWRKVVIPTMKSMGGRAPRKEVVWMNYDETGQKIQQDLELIKSFEKLSA